MYITESDLMNMIHTSRKDRMLIKHGKSVPRKKVISRRDIHSKLGSRTTRRNGAKVSNVSSVRSRYIPYINAAKKYGFQII